MSRFNILAGIREAYTSRTEPEAARFLALALWRAILILAIVSIIGSIAWGMGTLFSTLAALEPPATVPKIPGPTLDRGALAQTVSGLSARSTRFQAIQGATVSIPDPSK